MKKLKTIDLFAGIGGIRLGFENNGFETVFANDYDEYCKHTYDLNFKNTPLTVGDISKINIKELPKFDALLAGFPCQPFSIAGYRKGFEDNGRGNMFFEILKILRLHKPPIIFLENVKNLRGHDKGKTFTVIKEALEDVGYSIKAQVLNSAEYGNIPQNRERIYIVGFLDHAVTERFSFPKKISLTKTIRDLLETNVSEEFYYNGKPLYNKIKNDIISKNTVYQWRRVYVRENKKGYCPTLTANMGMGGHNVPLVLDDKGIRKLTPRECARIQGYKDSYKLPTNLATSRLYKQFGNSVSVTVISRIAKQIVEALEG